VPGKFSSFAQFHLRNIISAPDRLDHLPNAKRTAAQCLKKFMASVLVFLRLVLMLIQLSTLANSTTPSVPIS
jgi:hypothetical protein